MKLSPDTRYAIRILFELNGAGKALSIGTLSRITGIAPRAVEKVHTTLKERGITEGTVGAKGGIGLLRPLSAISLGELIACLDEGIEFSICCGNKANECPQRQVCATQAVWRNISHRVQSFLDSVMLADILLCPSIIDEI